jgi:hypothetical protein
MKTKGSMESCKAVIQILLSNRESTLCPELVDYLLEAVPASPDFDRVPEMDENWTFDTCSGLYTNEGASDRLLYWTAPFFIKIYN